MNRGAYWRGQLAASEKYCLTSPLLDMDAEEQTAQRERDQCLYDFEIWYWNGVIDYIRDVQARKQERKLATKCQGSLKPALSIRNPATVTFIGQH
jgi:hypothetical protein